MSCSALCRAPILTDPAQVFLINHDCAPNSEGLELYHWKLLMCASSMLTSTIRFCDDNDDDDYHDDFLMMMMVMMMMRMVMPMMVMQHC